MLRQCSLNLHRIVGKSLRVPREIIVLAKDHLSDEGNRTAEVKSWAGKIIDNDDFLTRFSECLEHEMSSAGPRVMIGTIADCDERNFHSSESFTCNK